MFVEIEIKHKRLESCLDTEKYETQIVPPKARWLNCNTTLGPPSLIKVSIIPMHLFSDNQFPYFF